MFNFKTFTAITALSLSLNISAGDFSDTVKACEQCHGENGNSTDSKTPTIANISPLYFIDTMVSFKEGTRPASIQKRDGKPDTDMKVIVQKLDDAMLKQLAEHYAKQTFLRPRQPFDASLVKKGKKHFLKNCGKCHEDSGRSSGDDAGILAGQKIDYLRTTMDEIISGKRVVSRKMKKKLDKMIKKSGPESVEQLIHYLASLQ